MTKKQDEAAAAALAEQLAQEEAPVALRPIQGNTDPRDFSVFDENGVFIERRDR